MSDWPSSSEAVGQTELQTLLPPNATSQERALEIAPAIGLADISNPFYTLWDPRTCPAHILPWLAWAFSVDNWRSDWPDEIKRDTIMASATIHRLKGTIGAVRRALETLGYAIDVSEWFEYGGTPHTFRIAVDVIGSHSAGTEISADLLTEITEVIENVKPVRSHFDVALNIAINAPAYAGAFQHTAIMAQAHADIPPAPVVMAQSRYAVVATTRIRSEIGG